MEKGKIRRNHTGLKVVGIILAALLLLGMGLYFYALTHTQLVVGLIQKAIYGESNPNSFEPLNAPGSGMTEAGQYKLNDIAYGSEYPNSFLDITYPNADTTAERPTLFYFHGGGFFGGSKAMGDPMAANEATALIDDLCAQGFNIVNVDYALVPDYRFPVPLFQMNEAIRFIAGHSGEYGIDMDNVVLMGSSAGAIMVAQYATVISSPEYAALLGIDPALSTEQVAAVVVDDAPLVYDEMPLACKILIGNYVKGSIYLDGDELAGYECIPHMTADYPAAFLLGSEYRTDMLAMSEKLTELGVEHVLIDPLEEYGTEQPHCFVANERTDPIASEAFERLTKFIGEKTR